MKMYRASEYGFSNIEEVEVKRITGHFVILGTKNYRGKNQREAIESLWHCYRNTYEEAKRWLIDKNKKKLESAQKSVKHLEDKLKECERL